MRSVSGTDTSMHWTASVVSEDYRYQHWHRHETGTDRPVLFYGEIDTHFVFYDVFGTNFQNIIPLWAI